MAKVLRGVSVFSNTLAQPRSLYSVLLLRLILGFTILAGSAGFLLGTTWDIQWHSLIGRDRTLIPPHIMMLGGIALCGLATLSAILIETAWARRNPALARYGTTFADTFHGSFGAYIAGFAALNAALAFPLDSYWHALYGVDVAIWAPFHIMFIVGMALVSLGCAYMLLSAAHLASREGKKGMLRIAHAGVIIAFATVLGLFTLLVIDAMGKPGTIHAGFIVINVYPVLAALLLGWTLVAAVFVLPGRWIATRVVAVYLLFAVVMQGFVPAATGWLMAIEQLGFRDTSNNPGISLASVNWPLAPILAAVGIDIVIGLARRRGWSAGRTLLGVLPVILLGSMPVIIMEPLQTLTLAGIVGGMGAVVSLLLGMSGAFIGGWFGRRTGEAMQQVERN